MLDQVIRITPERAQRYREEGLWRPERVDEIVLAHSIDRADAPALVSGDRTLTHAQLSLAVRSAAERLRLNGIRRGDPVLVQLPNDLELIVLTLALSRLGAPPVLTPTSLREFELNHLMRTTQAVAMAVPGRLARFDHGAMARQPMQTHSCLRTLIIPGLEDSNRTVDLKALCELPTREVEEGATATVEDIALCLLSNGTTGMPKVIPRLQEGYANQLRTTPALAEIGPDSVYLAVMPSRYYNILAGMAQSPEYPDLRSDPRLGIYFNDQGELRPFEEIKNLNGDAPKTNLPTFGGDMSRFFQDVLGRDPLSTYDTKWTNSHDGKR